ncbi:MAG: hypothetical protein BGO31_05285 [Bacteroidetes bacterium 43-16]|nr:MAG: hypothetical protein BGO31_05285 [Bacteroidetes bacterium 43-16]
MMVDPLGMAYKPYDNGASNPNAINDPLADIKARFPTINMYLPGGSLFNAGNFARNVEMVATFTAIVLGRFLAATGWDNSESASNNTVSENGGEEANSDPNEGNDGCKNCPVSPFSVVDQPSTAPESKKWDTNGDGKVDDDELTNWRENGKGQSIVLDASKLNMGELDYRNMKPGDKHTFYLYSGFVLRGNGFQEGRIIGAVGAIYVGAGRFTLSPNENDYKTGAEYGSPWFGSFGGFGRNVGTKIGLWIDGGKN